MLTITTQWCAIGTAWAETRAWGWHIAALTQEMENNCVHCGTLAKHSSVSSKKKKKYTAVLSKLIKEFENRLHNSWKKHHFGGIIATPFSVDINTLPANFQMQHRVAIRYSTQKSYCVTLCLYKTYPTSEKHSLLHHHILFMSLLLMSFHFMSVHTFVNIYFQG